MEATPDGTPYLVVNATGREYVFENYTDADDMWEVIASENSNPAFSDVSYGGFAPLDLPVVKDEYTFKLMYAVAWLHMGWSMKAIAGFFNYVGLVPFAYKLDEIEETFRDAWRGHWDSRAEYGKNYFEDFEPETGKGALYESKDILSYTIPMKEYYERAMKFVDWDEYARSLEPDTIYVDAPNDGSVYVYWYAE